MLDHVSISVPDIAEAERFYDAVMHALSVPKIGRSETWLGYGERCDAQKPQLSYLSVRVGPLVPGSSARHWCFKALDRAAVEAFWRAGLDHGGSDDGRPGIRSQYHEAYYAAYLCDPAGNRLEAVCHRGAV